MRVRKVEYHQGAITDAKSATAWYQTHSRSAALDFVDELQRAINTIQDAPDRWPIGRNDTRRFLLWRFPFSIIYSEFESTVTVWAVAHYSRHPEYWAHRLK